MPWFVGEGGVLCGEIYKRVSEEGVEVCLSPWADIGGISQSVPRLDTKGCRPLSTHTSTPAGMHTRCINP